MNKVNRSKLMFWTNLLSFVAIVVLVFSGLLMQAVYHMGRNPENISCMGLDKTAWSATHKITSMVCLILVVYHLYLNWQWLKKAISNKRSKNGKRIKKYSLWLSFIFVLATFTSLLSWLIIEDKNEARHIIEIHDKLGIVLFVMLIIHFIRHYRWFKNLFIKENKTTSY